VRTDRRKTRISDHADIFRFDERVGLDLQNELQWRVPTRLIQVKRLPATGRMACSISHGMCRSLTAIYANAEFLERSEVCASVRAEGSAICH
jgi:C4-dicarboxylate-specific signal transduction histidine kinase